MVKSAAKGLTTFVIILCFMTVSLFAWGQKSMTLDSYRSAHPLLLVAESMFLLLMFSAACLLTCFFAMKKMGIPRDKMLKVYILSLAGSSIVVWLLMLNTSAVFLFLIPYAALPILVFPIMSGLKSKSDESGIGNMGRN